MVATKKWRVTVSDRVARAKIDALKAAAEDMTPVMKTVGRVVVNKIRLCFKLGIDPWGSPWAKLKIRKGQPLVDTGLLRRSITSQADKSGVTIGTNKAHARVHQFGATITPKNGQYLKFPGPGGSFIFAKKVTVPQRSFLPLKKGQTAVALPVGWSNDVTKALRAYFIKSAQGKV